MQNLRFFDGKLNETKELLCPQDYKLFL